MGRGGSRTGGLQLAYLVQFFLLVPNILFVICRRRPLEVEVVPRSGQNFATRHHFAATTGATTVIRNKKNLKWINNDNASKFDKIRVYKYDLQHKNQKLRTIRKTKKCSLLIMKFATVRIFIKIEVV